MIFSRPVQTKLPHARSLRRPRNHTQKMESSEAEFTRRSKWGRYMKMVEDAPK
jgi:hypothetical protein